jgi:hypothetical protein
MFYARVHAYKVVFLLQKSLMMGVLNMIISGLLNSGEPDNTSEALADPKWKGAMDKEYIALINNQMWHLAPG